MRLPWRCALPVAVVLLGTAGFLRETTFPRGDQEGTTRPSEGFSPAPSDAVDDESPPWDSLEESESDPTGAADGPDTEPEWPEEPSGPVEVTLVVRALRDGSPVAGAVVDIFDTDFFRGCCPSGRGAAPGVDRGITDGDGRIRLGVPRTGPWTARARARGFAPSMAGGPEAPDGECVVPIVLEPAAALRGRVVDADDRPVPGAVVYVLPRDLLGLDAREPWESLRRKSFEIPDGWFMNDEGFERALVAVADDEGRYEVWGLLDDVPYQPVEKARPCRIVESVRGGRPWH